MLTARGKAESTPQFRRRLTLRSSPLGFTHVRIRADQIEQWAESHAAGADLPLLVRRLIGRSAGATALARRCCDRPAGVRRRATAGAGGKVWVPAGDSGREMGTGGNPRSKATADDDRRAGEAPADQRAALAFVVVTPRRWPGEDAWVQGVPRRQGWRPHRAPRNGVTLIVPSPSPTRQPRRGGGPQTFGTAIDLARPWHHGFVDALTAMGVEPSEADRKAHATGRSWPVYRRLNGRNPALARPAWLSAAGSHVLSLVRRSAPGRRTVEATLLRVATWAGGDVSGPGGAG